MNRKNLVLACCLLAVVFSGCAKDEPIPSAVPAEEPALAAAAVGEKEPGEYGTIPYVRDMLVEWSLTLQNDDLEASLAFFSEDCEGILLGGSGRTTQDWSAYLGNLMNLYVDASIEVEHVEVNGRGTNAEAMFLLTIDGAKSGDDFSRRIRSQLVFTDGRWQFSRYEELGDRT